MNGNASLATSPPPCRALIAGLATVVILAKPSVAGAGVPDSRRPADRVPVVLVHGALGSPDATWGSASDRKGLYSFLIGRGFEPGLTLFSVDYSDSPDGDYAALYHRLHRVVERARATSGHQRVDLVTHSMGALLARYYTCSPLYQGGVRTLVMIAPPSGGSFAATALRAALMTISQEAGRLWTSAEMPRGFPPFRDERDYVARRAAELYEPLYGEFLLDTRVAGQARSSSEPFEEWLARSRPDIYGECFASALEPPLQPDWDIGDAPGPGKDLTRAYYERLGLEAGRNNYLRSRRARGSLVDALVESPPPLSGDVKEVIKEYSRRALFYLAGRVVDLSIEKGKMAAARLLESTFKVNADSPALRRMVCREIRLTPSAEPVLANHFLHRWTGLERANRAAMENEVTAGADGWPESPRYVVIAGGAMMADLPWKSIDENDGVVEVAATLIPSGSDDVFKVFRGLTWPNHIGLLRNPTVKRYVAGQLGTYFPIRATHYPSFLGGRQKWFRWSESGEVTVTPWEPIYVAVDGSRLKGGSGSLDIEVTADDLPEGVEFRAWLHKMSSDGGLERQEIVLSEAPRTGVVRGSVAMDGLGSQFGRVLLGMRLVGSFSTGSQIRRMENASRRVRYALSFDAAAHGEEQKEAAPPPVIHAVRTSKKAVSGEFLLGDCSAWEWDFGDGAEFRDEGDKARSVVSHAFPPGEYKVRARATDEKGRVLGEESWDIAVSPNAPEDGEESESAREFEFAAGGDGPDVRVEVTGPAMWVTGRPARFVVNVDAGEAGASEKEVITVEPGREFDMVWEKPGTFRVTAAAKVRLTYDKPGGRVSLTRTYTGSTRVEVVTTSVTD